jgi:O-antigen ligase
MKNQQLEKNKSIKIIFLSALIITIYFNTQIQDAFNSPKFWALILSTAVLLADLIMNGRNFSRSENKFVFYLLIFLLIYLIVMLISTVFAYNPQVALLGETFRRNGIVTSFGLAVFLLAATIHVKFNNILVAFKIIFLTGFLVGAYSLIQITGNDWNTWSDTNSIISTLGNSNFSGAVMAILSIILFGQLFLKSFGKIYKTSLFVTLIILVYSIYETKALQALLILAIGIGLQILFLIYKKNNYAGILFFFAGTMGAFLAILGMLQKGPFQSFLYKDSVSVRGYYWRAGFEMFKDHLWFGVGIDNYGYFFKEYREVGYPLNYGFNITSSNAHNVFIQYFATGGLIIGVMYLLLQLLIAYKAVQILKNNNGEKRFIALMIVSAWLAFQAQSIISIDNIGISIWGWILGGVIFGLSLEDRLSAVVKNKREVIDIRKSILSLFTLSVAMFLVVPLYIVDRATWLSRTYYVPGNIEVKNKFDDYSSRVLTSNFAVNDYKNIALTSVIAYGDKAKAIVELQKILEDDYRNLDSLNLLASIYEESGDFIKAITIRNKMAEFDPWNAVNYVGLAQLYKLTNQIEEMDSVVTKIMSFAGNDPIAEVVKKEFLS